ncbi:ABC transporter substrate-binding protein [Treponema sp.]|uniref:ABC transporter substrate-binding protein n=1 Tax=Treponema sp. TaxID=166 RepID=UPI0025DEE578|nr:ABC transporter substrate-binding protein [Treponema sp.]MCR5218716.1 hypothetical protein [Treponema sp.]
MKKIYFLTATFLTSALLTLTACSEITGVKGEYTYRTTSTCPSTWNPAEYHNGCESTVISLTATGLYDFIMNKTKDNYEVICELARAFPQDVTKEYSGRYDIPALEQSGYAWKFDMITHATWDDGTPINADTIGYTLSQFLNPQMKNYRASNWYEGMMALVKGYDYYEGKCSWNEVGFVKNDDYSFTLIFTKKLTLFQVEYGSTSILLLKKDLFEAGKKKTGEIIKTNYCTDASNSPSYGPYKVKRFQQDKEMLLVKNPTWFGYYDNYHDNQYQTTAVNIQYINEHTTILNMFLQGKLDETSLTPNELKIYGNRIYRKTSPLSYTWKFSFNIDKEKLKSKNKDSENHVMLSYQDFRHAISLSLNRQEITDTISPSSEAGFGLLNNLYVCNPETNELYRENPLAIENLCKVYDVSSPQDLTGYNKKLAAKYFESAYKKALANGDIKDSDKFYIDFHTYNTSETNMRLITCLQDSINEAAAGTPFEKRIIINQVTDENYYVNMKNGNVDCAVTAWGGSSYDPYGITECYCSKTYLNEYGFEPEEEKLTITINGKEYTKTYADWSYELNEGKYASENSNLRTNILSQIEAGLLLHYNMLPLWYSTSSYLTSQRMIEGSDHYINALVEFGGIRFRRWSMDDYDWEVYCKENNNSLRY